MMQNQTALEARHLTKTVSSPEGPLTILTDVSLTVRSGETLAVVGASGAGNRHCSHCSRDSIPPPRVKC